MSNSKPESFYQTKAYKKHLQIRYRREFLFRKAGFFAVFIALSFLSLLIGHIVNKGYKSFYQYNMLCHFTFDNPSITPEDSFNTFLNQTSLRDTRKITPQQIKQILSSTAFFTLQNKFKSMGNPSQSYPYHISFQIPLSDKIDQALKSNDIHELAPAQRQWIKKMQEEALLTKRFNFNFFTAGNSRYPERAGISSGMVGSLLTLSIAMGLSLFFGISAGIYLEEFAPKNLFTHFIEVNINNLAAVPSIIFGLLGLSIFIQFFHIPRSTPLIGGIVLALMTLPTIIMTTRIAIEAVPSSIRDAALGMGASPLQVIFHHILPLSVPGILTGAIISLARALGETAPLLMIGMVAFIVDVPTGITDAATTLPVQIYIWATSPENAFIEKASGAILVLLTFLILLNSMAALIRMKFEKKW